MRRKFTSRLAVVLALSLALGAALPGCGGKPADSGKQTTVAGTAAPDASKGPKAGGTLKMATSRDALVIGYPAKIMWGGTIPLIHPAIESLFRLDEKGNVVPFLAKGWKTSEDGKTVVITLNEGIKFHDGTDFNAEAVKWNLERFIEEKAGSVKKITAITVTSPYELKIELSAPDSLLIPNLALNNVSLMISPSACNKNGKDWAAKNPVGTGPFKFESWQQDVKSVYVKNGNYWQKGKPYLDKIEIQIIKDASVETAALQNNDVDTLYNLPPLNYEDLKKSGKYNMVVSSLPSGIYGLMPDSNNKGVLSNVKVRQAIWAAIDFEKIIKTTMSESFQYTNQLSIKGSWSYNSDVKGYPYDPAKAKELLKEAGYPDGFNTNLYLENTDVNRDLGAAIQSYLNAVGIKAKIDMMDTARYEDMVIRNGWKDGLALIPLGTIPNPLNPLNSMLAKEFHAKKLPSLEVPEEIEKICDVASNGATQADIAKAMFEYQKLATDKYAMIIWMYGTLGAVSKQKYVMNDEIGQKHMYQWTPENAWLGK